LQFFLEKKRVRDDVLSSSVALLKINFPALFVIRIKSLNRKLNDHGASGTVADTPSLEVENRPASSTCSNTCSKDNIDTAMAGVLSRFQV